MSCICSSEWGVCVARGKGTRSGGYRGWDASEGGAERGALFLLALFKCVLVGDVRSDREMTKYGESDVCGCL